MRLMFLVIVLTLLSFLQCQNSTDFKSPFYEEDFIEVNKIFGKQRKPIGLTHIHRIDYRGINYKVKENAPALSIQSGTIEKVSTSKFSGGYIVINHGNEIEAKYYHLKEIKVKEGDVVKKGTLIGISSNIGWTTVNSIGLEISKNGEIIDPNSILK